VEQPLGALAFRAGPTMVKSKPSTSKRLASANIAKFLKSSKADPPAMEVDPPSPQERPLAMEVSPSPPSTSSPPPTSLTPPPARKLPPTPASKSLTNQASHHTPPGPDPRAHILYFDLVVPNAPTAGLDIVGSYHLSLIRMMEALFKVDNTISFFPFGLPQSSECDVLKLGSTLGESLSQISSYFDGLRLAREAYPPLFVSVLLGFDSEDDLFVPNCQAQLNGFGGRITLHPLQCAKVSAAGWVFGTHGDTDPDHLSTTIQEALDSYYPGNGLRLGFRLKQLWSGSKKTEPASSPTPPPAPSHTRPPGLHVVHIDCECDHEAAAKAMIGAVLHLPTFSLYSNLPLRLVDVLWFNSSEEEQDAFASAYKRQSNISSSLSWVNSQDFL